jgi:predicted metal-dependent hydrolase
MDNEIIDETVDPIVEDGQVEGGDEVVDFDEESQFDYINVDEFGDKYVKIVVDGEELEVPLKEAVSGYQRQSDYTRKTQQIAEERKGVQFAKAIQEALDNDPTATIELLKQHYGIQEQDAFSDEDDLYMDPMEKQYKQLEHRLRSFEEQQALNELERTIGGLQQKYGEDFDANEVVSKALAAGTTDLEGVYKQMAFDKLYQRQQAERELQGRRAQQEQKTVQAKRSSGIVAGGSSAKGSTSDSQPITSLRDAFDAAKKQLGISG